MNKLLITVFLSFINPQGITFSMDNPSLKMIISEIESQTDYKFVNENDINLTAELEGTYNFENINLDEVLEIVSGRTTYTLINMGNKLAIGLDSPEKTTTNKFSEVQILVEGTVTDANGVPLPSVNIQEEGTNNGVLTDFDGNFSIDVRSEESVLVFSYIGMQTTRRIVGNNATMIVPMQENEQALDEVVVIGYGTEKQVNVIGSVTTISSEEISSAPVSNISSALAGRIPGAVVQQSNGEPGNNGASIVVRGMATIGNNEPLVVIDGIPGRDINSVNPNDVESVSILKDASAAIYGARAANGVILVTTKRGTENTPLNVNYSFYQGFLSPTSLPEMADAPTYAEMVREQQLYQGVDVANIKFTEEDIQRYRSGNFPWTHPNTDWIDASFKKFSQTRNHNIAVNGGNEKVNYYASFGTQYDGGIFKNSSTSFNRYNIKATVDAKVNEYLTLGIDINGSEEHRMYPSVNAGFNLEGAIKSLPTSPAVYPNGLPGPDIAFGQNPIVAVTDQTGFDDSRRYRANSIFSASLKIPGVKGLTLSSYYAYDLNLGQRKLFQTPWTLYQLDEGAYLAAGNTGVEDGSDFLVGTSKGTSEPWLRNYYDDSKRQTFNIKADYSTTINEAHNLSAFVAYETSEYEAKGTNAFRRYFVSDKLPYLFAGGDAEKDNSEFVSIDSRINYFGRLSYNYKETYLFQFSFRRDGSLRFSKESGRWGNFPGVLAGWRISNENFWNISFINSLKLKASWGQLGNDLVLPFQYLPTFSLSQGYVTGSGRNYYSGLTQLGATNPNITWEVANVYNAGFESKFWDYHFTLNADFFYQRRNNILIKRNASVPQFTGIQLPDENFGIVDSKGVEVVLGYDNSLNDFTYSVNGNFAFSRNKIIEFDEPNQSVPWQVLTGHPQGSRLVYHSLGIFRDEEQIENTPHVAGAIPGDIIIQDYNDDGEINSDDRILNTKAINPEITYGISFNTAYKNWTLSGLVEGAGNSNRKVLVELQGLSGNYFAYDAVGRWTPDNINASKPRAFERQEPYWRSDYLTDYSFQNSAYARMKNLRIAYTFPENILDKIKLKGAQVYLSGQNLFLIYNANKLLDPELGGIRTNSSDLPAGALYAGPEYNYPLMKIYTLGMRISL